jgi:hypothetical protein
MTDTSPGLKTTMKKINLAPGVKLVAEGTETAGTERGTIGGDGEGVQGFSENSDGVFRDAFQVGGVFLLILFFLWNTIFRPMNFVALPYASVDATNVIIAGMGLLGFHL